MRALRSLSIAFCLLLLSVSTAQAQECAPSPARSLVGLSSAPTTSRSEAVLAAIEEPESLGLEKYDYELVATYELGAHLFSVLSLVDGFERGLILVRETLGHPLDWQYFPGEWAMDPYGKHPTLLGLSAMELVDGGDPELVGEYYYSTEGHCDNDDEHDCEVPGPTHYAVVIFDTSLRVLASARYRCEISDAEEYSCKGSVAVQDLDCDGRPELVASNTCEAFWGKEQMPAHAVFQIAASTPAPAPPALPTELIHDDRPFLVIEGSWAEGAPRSRQQAEARAKELRENGQDEAQVFLSRQFEALEWGYVIVISKRAATMEEAEEEAFGAAVVKQGFYDQGPLPPLEGCHSSEVVGRPRGYRLRVSACEGDLHGELFNATGKRKAQLRFLQISPEAVKSWHLEPLSDLAGKPVAVLVWLELTNTRQLLLLSADKTTPRVLYAASLRQEVEFETTQGRVVLSDGALQRTLELQVKKGELAVSVAAEDGQALKAESGMQLEVEAELVD